VTRTSIGRACALWFWISWTSDDCTHHFRPCMTIRVVTSFEMHVLYVCSVVWKSVMKKPSSFESIIHRNSLWALALLRATNHVRVSVLTAFETDPVYNTSYWSIEVLKHLVQTGHGRYCSNLWLYAVIALFSIFRFDDEASVDRKSHGSWNHHEKLHWTQAFSLTSAFTRHKCLLNSCLWYQFNCQTTIFKHPFHFHQGDHALHEAFPRLFEKRTFEISILLIHVLGISFPWHRTLCVLTSYSASKEEKRDSFWNDAPHVIGLSTVSFPCDFKWPHLCNIMTPFWFTRISREWSSCFIFRIRLSASHA
jgi:hypothetical protein